MAELKLALMPTSDTICPFTKLGTECLLCTILYAGLGIKQMKRLNSHCPSCLQSFWLMNEHSDNYIGMQ